MDNVSPDITEGVNLFNNSFYFEAHDFFEEIWMETNGIDKLFFQGLIQVAVGAYHFSRCNYKAAHSQFMKAKSKLKKYLPVHYSVDVRKIVDEVAKIILQIEDAQFRSSVKLTEELLFKIDFFQTNLKK